VFRWRALILFGFIGHRGTRLTINWHESLNHLIWLRLRNYLHRHSRRHISLTERVRILPLKSSKSICWLNRYNIHCIIPRLSHHILSICLHIHLQINLFLLTLILVSQNHLHHADLLFLDRSHITHLLIVHLLVLVHHQVHCFGTNRNPLLAIVVRIYFVKELFKGQRFFAWGFEMVNYWPLFRCR